MPQFSCDSSVFVSSDWIHPTFCHSSPYNWIAYNRKTIQKWILYKHSWVALKCCAFEFWGLVGEVGGEPPLNNPLPASRGMKTHATERSLFAENENNKTTIYFQFHKDMKKFMTTAESTSRRNWKKMPVVDDRQRCRLTLEESTSWRILLSWRERDWD